MKILFLEPCSINFGGYFRAMNISQALVKRGHQVDLLVNSDKKWFPKIEKKRLSPNLTQFTLPRFFIHPLVQGRLLRALIGILFAVFGRYDIIHIGMVILPETNIPALFLKLIGKKNIVIDWDDLAENGAFKDNSLINSYIRICEHRFSQLFYNFCVASRILYRRSKLNRHQNVIKIINGVNPHQYRLYSYHQAIKTLKLDPKFTYLLCVGNTYFGQRGTHLLRTIKYLSRLDPKIKFISNFDPKTIAAINHIKLPSNLSSHFITVGFIPPKKLGLYTAVSAGALFYMENSINDRSGFPIRVGTYLHGKLPIFTNDNRSEASNTLKQYHCALLARNPKDLALRTVRTLNNPQQLSQLKHNVLKARQQLSIHKVVIPLIDFYRQILLPPLA